MPGATAKGPASAFKGFSSSEFSSECLGCILIIWLLLSGLPRSLWSEEALPTLVLMLLWESSTLEDCTAPTLEEVEAFPWRLWRL